MKNVYGYIRVSTVKQGLGVSLQEQKEAIVRYAEKHDLTIVEWFEELETAAKQGRTFFTKMMALLQKGKVNGVIIHKIDRSARNLKDWASLGDLIDKGVEIHFAHESLDMDTRGGRLAADIQAVIASDYIRNLRDETKKGLYGRLKQGIYPFGAPVGYVNNGSGQLKTIDEVKGPLVKKAFELYRSREYSLDALAVEMKRYGLRSASGKPLPPTSISRLLKNPFYAGVLKVKGKTFKGCHQPLIPSKLFIEVQDILAGKSNSKLIKHGYIFRRMMKCYDCGYALVGEKQKGRIYYRCHTRECPTKAIREDLLESSVLRLLSKIKLSGNESSMLEGLLEDSQKNWSINSKGIEESIRLQRTRISNMLERLTDAYIEETIDKGQFLAKKEKLLIELQELNNRSGQVSTQKELIYRKAKNILELVRTVKNSYISALAEEKRRIIRLVTSNFVLQGKSLMITMQSPFKELANRHSLSLSGLDRSIPRTRTAEVDSTDNNSQQSVDNPELKERMKLLLDIILTHFEVHGDDNEEEEEI